MEGARVEPHHSLWRAATHEAGHAVMAYVHHGRVEGIRVHSGHCDAEIILPPDTEPARKAVAHMLVALAGLEAEALLCGRIGSEAGQPDLRQFKAALRLANAAVVNRVLALRNPHLWGDGHACASDGKRFESWRQNLMTEWRSRYQGYGILVYWHVETNAVCIYSQLRNFSFSEVAAMIEGLIRHDTEMRVEKNFVDSHGQSEVAFAFCHLLGGVRLMPRLKRLKAEPLGTRGRDYLERMQQAAARMQTLITDLLAFSRVTTQARPFGPVDLARIAQEVIDDLEVRLEQVGGRVAVAALPTIDADPLQMRQLLQNLLGNALKFHRPEAPPVVTIASDSLPTPAADGAEPTAPPRWCQLVVADNGIGFEEKYLDRIFAPFQRLHGRSEYEGTGIGLAVCRKIAERHGGRITAHSAPGQGATFVVTLPVTHTKGERTS